MMIGDETFHLKWNSYHTHFHSALLGMLESECMVDVTLAAEGKFVHAHQVVLSACSSYFRELLSPQSEKRVIIFLRDVKFEHLKSLVDYMYSGQVVVKQNQLSEFLKTAMNLSIHGLSQANNNSSTEQTVQPSVLPVPVSSPHLPNTQLLSSHTPSGTGGPSESDHTISPEPEWYPPVSQSIVQPSGPSSSTPTNLKRATPPIERQSNITAVADCQSSHNVPMKSSSLNSNLLEQAIKSELEPDDVVPLPDENQLLPMAASHGDLHLSDSHNDCNMLDEDDENSNDDDPLNLDQASSALPLYTVLGANVDAWQGSARHYRRQPGPLRVGSFSPYICGRCGRQYRRQQHLTRHQKSECGAYKTYQCSSCSKGYSRAERLREHMEKAHSQPSIP